MPDFRRRPNRLPRQSYLGRNWYFITICTRGRRPCFADGSLVGFVLDALRAQCQTHSLGVYAYCFMPDHLHLELVGLAADSDVIKMLKTFKGQASSAARRAEISNLWQKGFYDHVLREGDNADAVAWYIFNNPVRKGLVQNPRDWPWSGSWMFDWKKAVAPLEKFVPPWK